LQPRGNRERIDAPPRERERNVGLGAEPARKLIEEGDAGALGLTLLGDRPSMAARPIGGDAVPGRVTRPGFVLPCLWQLTLRLKMIPAGFGVSLA
jgi:hypothetical protein